MYTRGCKKALLVKKTKKKSKKSWKHKSLSSDDCSTSSESDTPQEGKYAKSCSKEMKKCKITKRKKISITTLMCKMIQGHFDTFKPIEVILKLAENFMSIKSIPESVIKEMDP